MSESEGRRNVSPLLSERGTTIISDTVVSQVAGMAAREVDGVHMGGGASRTASGVLGSITGSESKTSGVSVEVGRTETAIDLKMGIEYNKNILQTVEEVRRRITDRVESLTGLRIKELNATITDITFPEGETAYRLPPASSTSEPEESPEEATETVPEAQATPEDVTGEPDEPDTTQVETTGDAPTEERASVEETSVEEEVSVEEEASVEELAPEEEATVEDRPPEDGETTELRTEEQPEAEASEAVTRAESETPEEPETRQEPEASKPEPDTPEARMRRRAEERARRRRRRSQDS